MRAHLLTLLLPIGAIAYGLWFGLGLSGILWLEGLVLAVIVCVLLHELGHAWVARRLKVPIHDILLLPLGGAARLEKLPSTAAQEAAVVFAGPLVNLVLGLLLLPAIFAMEHGERMLWEGNFSILAALASLSIFNLLVFVINLLPTFPLDGGRLLRALLTRWMSRLEATRTTAMVGRVVLLALIALAIWKGEYFIALLPSYLFLIAGKEVHLAMVQHFLEQETLGEYALAVRVFDPWVPIEDVLHQLRRNDQLGAVVADECSPIGFVTLPMLMAVTEPSRHVGDLEMLTVVCHDSDAELRRLSHQFASLPHSIAIEEIDGRPAGYMDLDALGAAFEKYQEGA